jgi:hypothetical protein
MVQLADGLQSADFLHSRKLTVAGQEFEGHEVAVGLARFPDFPPTASAK